MGKEFKEEYNRHNKIVTPYAKIKCGHGDNGNYWNIHYLDPEDGEVHIGFGSYRRDLVEKWLNEEFEVYNIQEESHDFDEELRKAFRQLAKVITQKYPRTVRATIKLDGGVADIECEQTFCCDYMK